MKILVVSPFFYPAYHYGGPVETLYQNGKAWVEQGHAVEVVTTDANGRGRLKVDTKKSADVAGMRVWYCRRLFLSAVSVSLLAKLFRRIKTADLVVLDFVYSFPAIPTIVLCRLFRKKLVWEPRGALQEWSGRRKIILKKCWDLLCAGLLPANAYFHFTSQAEARESVAKIKNHQFVVVPNGVVVPTAVLKKEKQAKIRLLFLGRIHPKKGLENLLRALTLLNKETYLLEIYGDGESAYVKKIKEMIVRLGQANNARMRGFAAREELGKIFAQADVLILPSHGENFGNVVAEALAHGVPVIASKSTPWEGLEDHRCGFWVENDAESLALAITEMTKRDMVEMGARGREWMKQDFNWPSVAKKIISGPPA